MASPFDEEGGTFFVLINAEGQYSIWPSFIPVPAGWVGTLGPATRQACVDYIEEYWTDMRPGSLITLMSGTLDKASSEPGVGD